MLDDRAPTPGRDAGSAAVVSHMRSLERLGYRVVFVAVDRAGVPVPGFESAPAHETVEDVLLRHADAALVYVHRVAGMALYGALVRRIMPAARLAYALADLHFLRVGRQAALANDPALLADSRRLRDAELAAARLADVVITHSPFEADLLRRLVPGLGVRVVPWSVQGCAAPAPWAGRHGLLFVGSAAHAPNADAVGWLVDAVLPLVRAADPSIRCTLAGEGHAARAPGVAALGHVPDLAAAYAAHRLAVAPLRFGAGVKGKVVEAFAHGVPCAMTPIAAEGLPLSAALMPCVADDAMALAAAIVRLHDDPTAWAAAAQAGQALAAHRFSDDAVDDALGAAVASSSATLVRPRVRRRRTG